MAKLAFSKLGLKENKETTIYVYQDQEIEVKQYLPIKDKLELLSKVVNRSMSDESRYFNSLKLRVFLDLEFVYYYTNLSFTSKQKEDEIKLYDLLESNGIIDGVIACAQDEYNLLTNDLNNIIDAIYKYQNSALGVLTTISQDYSNLSVDLDKLQQQISDPDSLELLKQIGPMLGLN